MVAAAVVALAALAGAWFGGRPPPALPVAVERTGSPPAGDSSPDPVLTVHVSGAVARPGLVEVSPGARVADVIAAAGGALPTADLSVLNLAGPVTDGQQVIVLEAGGARLRNGGWDSGGKVHLNTADVAQIETLPGVGPVLAARIVAHRDEHGPFRTVEDLLDVPGIGEGKLATLRPEVVVP